MATLVYHYPASDTSDNNLVIIGCIGWSYATNRGGLFLDDPDPIYRELKEVGSHAPVSA